MWEIEKEVMEKFLTQKQIEELEVYLINEGEDAGKYRLGLLCPEVIGEEPITDFSILEFYGISKKLEEFVFNVIKKEFNIDRIKNAKAWANFAGCNLQEIGDYPDQKLDTIPQIDLVIVDLYPFEETVASGGSEQEIIEKIDIGGIALIRAAAKNFTDVFCVSDKKDYADFLNILINSDCAPDLDDRKRYSVKAFQTSSHYDTAIFNYFNKEEEVLKLSIRKSKILRYGENPHQKGNFFGHLSDLFDQIHGKEVSYLSLIHI